MGSPERPQREGGGGEQSVEQRKCKLAGMQRRRDRQRQHRAEAPGEGERQRRAHGQARQRAETGKHQHLGQIDREYARAGRAQRLEGGDYLAPAVEVALDRVRHAHASDQQRRETDQGEVLREALDVAFERGRGIAARAHFPAGLRQLRLRCRRHRAHRRIGRVVAGQAQAVVPAHHASGLQKPGGAQRRLADEEARAEADAAGKLVRLGRQRGANFDGRGADRDARGRLEIEARQQRGVGGGAECAVALRQRLRKRLRRLERDFAVERIGGVDRLHLDQRRAPVISAFTRVFRRAMGARHGAQGGGERDQAAAGEKRALVGACFAQAERECEVTAEDDAALAREPVGKSGRHRAHPRNCHDPERDAGDEHVKSAQAPAQFARGKAQRQHRAAARSPRAAEHAHKRWSRHDRAVSSCAPPSMRPERRRTTRSQRAASAASWVTSTSVVPRCT